MSTSMHIIVNPTSGNDEPILAFIKEVFEKSDFKYEVFITQNKNDAFDFAKRAHEQRVDIVGVYGGDGTVMQVARALYKTTTPMAIIPGGTANVVAKELGIPLESKEALELLAQKNFQKKIIDMATYNDKPFLIRLNVGTLAAMVQEADPRLKGLIGQAAYALAALKHLAKPKLQSYHLTIDGKEIDTQGVALVVANSGNVGIPGLSLMATIDMADGMLDVMVFKQDNVKAFIAWANSAMSGSHQTDVIEHWKAKEVFVRFQKPKSMICDDVDETLKEFQAKIVPKALTVLVPLQTK